MRQLFLLLALILALNGLAQHSTLRFTDNPIELSRQSLLLVPFESKMYSSDINKKLAEFNQMNSQEIIERFTAAIDQSILYTFQERCDVSSFYQLEGQDITQDLKYIYDNLELEYELVSKTEEKSKAEKLKEKLKKKEEDNYQRSSIESGQIVTKRDLRERYMKAVVKDQKMLDSIHFKFDNKFFLFVNQLDIRNDYSDMIAVQQGNYDRIIQIHYTLYQKDGTILTTGISKTTFPSDQNDINQIIKNNFPILAQYIYDDLFPPVEQESDSKLKIKKLWK